MKSRILATLFVAVCPLLTGCFNNDEVPVSPCYPAFYLQVIGNARYEETYTFDQLNRPVNLYSENRVGSGATTYNSIEYSYGKNGVLSTVEYGDGGKYTYTSDNAGKITSAIYTNSSGTSTQKQEFTYNTSGQLVKRQYYTYSNNSPVKSTSYTYEYATTSTKNYTKRSFFNATDVLQSYITYTYDSKPNPSVMVSIFPNVITTNNVLKQVNSNATGTSQITWTWSYTYSAKGFPLTYKASNGLGNEESYTFEYVNCLK